MSPAGGHPAWVRWCVAFLPRDIRDEYGAEMADVAARRVASGDSSLPREMADLLRAAARERLHQAADVGRSIGMGGGEPVINFLKDVRYAVRMLVKTPVVTVIAVLSLSLGIAATASALAMVDGFLYSSVPWDDGDRIVNITMENPRSGFIQGGVSPASYLAFAAEEGIFEDLTYTEPRVTNVADDDGEPQQIQMVGVDEAFHRVVSTTPAIGRSIDSDDLRPGAEPVAVLMHLFWERRYGADPGIVGRRIQLAGSPHTVIGVMPEGFELLPANVHVIRPASLSERTNDHQQAFIPLGRLAEGVTTEEATARLRQVQETVAAAEPETYEGWVTGVRTLGETFPGPSDRILIQILFAVALLGLLIACANVANLLLSRAEERQREVSVRTAMGAPRGRIVAQLLTESLVLAAVAGVIGVGAAVFLVDLFSLSMPAQLPRALYPELSPLVLGLSVGVTLMAGLVFGLAPALHAVRGDLRASLTGSRGGTAGRRRQRLRNGFVVAEFAVAVALLTGATMLVRALGTLSAGEPGFRIDDVMVFTVQPLEDRYPDAATLDVLRRDLVAALAERPEIASSAALSQLPRSQVGRFTPVRISGEEEAPDELTPTTSWVGASPDYLDTYDIALRNGRWFTEADGRDAEPVVVVTEAFVRRFFPDRAPLGELLILEDAPVSSDGRARRVVGVVADVALQRLETNAVPLPAVYVPTEQVSLRATAFAVRAAGPIEPLGRVIREAVASVDPSLPVGGLKTMETHVDQQLAGPRMIGYFAGGVGLVALILAALGIYGVMAHSVVQRTREIGIRMAMGAERGKVIGMVAKGGLRLVAVGMVVGLPLAWAMSRMTVAAIGEITEILPIWQVAVSVGGMLAAVACIACVVPAVRASTIRPARALARD